MRKNVISLIFILLSFFIADAHLENITNKTDYNVNLLSDTASAKYFPMHVGNVYKYYSWDFPYPSSGTYFKARITKDTVAFGKRYFYCVNFPSLQNGYIRYDSASGLLLHLYPGNGCGIYPNDKIIDSLSARINNSLNYCPYNITMFRTCTDTLNITLFNYYTTKRKRFAHDGLILSYVVYARNIGIVDFGSGEPPPISHYVDLKGCCINGVLYGDTTLMEIKKISSEIPTEYSLEQNYPNPFNSITNFKFSIPLWRGVGGRFVTLKVFDIFGKEVATLVNEKLNPGTYKVRFDAGDLPSGIYFYRMQIADPLRRTENFTSTKKLILLK